MSSLEPNSFYTKLNRSEKDQVDNWNLKRNSLIQEKTQRSLLTIMRDDEQLTMKSTPFIRFLCRGAFASKNESHDNNETILTIWNPTEEQINLLREGCVVRGKNLGAKYAEGGLLPKQLIANSNSYFEESRPQPSVTNLVSMGYESRNYQSLMFLEAACRKNQSLILPAPEFDCAGCLLKVVKCSSGLMIYLIDESNCILRIEREIDHEKGASLLNWERAMLNLQSGVCLFFNDIKILRFDKWEEVTVGVWTEFSSQQVSTSHPRGDQLKSWSLFRGKTECIIASQKLSCGIIDLVPDENAIVIGRISSFKLFDFEGMRSDDSRSLHDFDWVLTISNGERTFQAAVSNHLHHSISQLCIPDVSTVMEQEFERSKLLLLSTYFCEQLRKETALFRFVIDTKSEHILHAERVEVTALTQIYMLPH